jgi:hypothetical protein
MSNYLLVLERSEGNLAVSKEGDKYVLEGIFTEIGVKNKNNRIYDEKELLPHIEELQTKLKGNKLLGELDHPKSFDISLRNASHVIEDISYDKGSKKVTGRIRLLNTDAGKQAMALVDAGVPLHISSRAAGVVEGNGHVKIKKMFTYDLVADPGFANAELKRVNESFGFSDDDLIQIFEIPSTIDESFVDDKYTKQTKKEEMDSNQYIKVEDFNEYTKHLKEEIDGLKKSLTESKNSNDSEINEGLVRYAEETAKRVNQIQEYVGKLAESVDGLISHNDYIVENLEKVKDYAEMVGERSNQGINYAEKLAESVDHLIEYTKIIAEKADQGIEYTKHIAEMTDNNIEYTKHVALKADQGIEYTKYIANENSNRWNYQTYMNEQLDNVISHNDYIVEGTSSIIEYTEYLKEQTENLANYMNHVVEKINEGFVPNSFEPKDDFEKEISEKIGSILESVKEEVSFEKKDNNLNFLNFLSESKRNQFHSLNDDMKERVISTFESNKYYGSADAEKLFESIFIIQAPVMNWLSNMPSKYREAWNGLNESQKNAIKAQASVRNLDTQYKIDDFWSTRDLRTVKVETPLTESNETVIEESPKYVTPSTYMQTVEDELRRRFKR